LLHCRSPVLALSVRDRYRQGRPFWKAFGTLGAACRAADALIYLEKSEQHAREDLAELFAAMEGDDEQIMRVDPNPELISAIPKRTSMMPSARFAPDGLWSRQCQSSRPWRRTHCR
jgi:hypothetical protein